MKYKKVAEGRFISRPNRFIAEVMIKGEKQTVHVKNTGRCKELLQEGAKVYLSVSDNPDRKTKYDLIAVEKKTADGIKLINMDSQIPNDAADEWLRKGNLFSADAKIRREYKFGNSRFDFYIEDGNDKILLEVKGVTLENDGVAAFPDAPTERGVKHINELASALRQGYKAYILFVIQMTGVKELHPNDITHKAFGDALRKACSEGVQVIAVDCRVVKDGITVNDFVKVNLDEE